MLSSKVITGERIQNLADVSLGLEEDFCNTNITKKIYIDKILTEYDNPGVIFCFGNRLDILAKKIHLFKNKFNLITHNSKFNVNCDDENVITILENKNVIKWFTQNLCFQHEKMIFLPSGIANMECTYGKDFILFNRSVFDSVSKMKNPSNCEVYMSFTIEKNIEKRSECYIKLRQKVLYLPYIESLPNFWRFSTYQYCICPEGEGIDTNRIWEAIYLRVVPIMLRSSFSNILERLKFPIIVLDSWDDFDVSKLPEYKSFDFMTCLYLLDIDFYKSIIRR